MNELEIEYFKEGILAAKDEFYFDAIRQFQDLINQFPESDLADDAYYDLGLCYFQMNQFEKAIDSFKVVINDYPDGTISVLNGAGEYGSTSAKAWFGIMNCYLGLNSLDQAKGTLQEMLKYKDTSYVLNQKGEKVSFYQTALNSIEKFKSTKGE